VITLTEHMAEARRELALRRACYPAWGTGGTRDAGTASYHWQAMEASERTLEPLAVAQRQLALVSTSQVEGCPKV
jgi:hypothetical protein